MTFWQLLVLAILVESIWETFKMAWQEGKVSIDKIGAMVIGVLVAILTGLDLFTLVGIPMTVPYVGLFLTGIVLSRGSNYVHDLAGTLQGLMTSKK